MVAQDHGWGCWVQIGSDGGRPLVKPGNQGHSAPNLDAIACAKPNTTICIGLDSLVTPATVPAQGVQLEARDSSRLVLLNFSDVN